MGADATSHLKAEDNELKAEAPPPYATPSDNENPPAYSPPSSYSINSRALSAPLVTIEQLKAHLSLLRAFKNLRDVFDKGEDIRLPASARTLEPIPRWGWFVGLAVERYVWI